MSAQLVCAWCGASIAHKRGHINRSLKLGAKLYCNRTCTGLARRKGKTKAQRVEEKRLYDIKYRAEHPRDPAERAAYYQRTRDPEKEAAYRKANMPRHVEYCRRPEYKKWKTEYDKKHRANKFFGPFAEAAMLAIDLNRAIKERMTNHEIKWQNGTSNKTQFRAREAKEESRGRPRNRLRSRPNQAAVG